MSCVVSCVPRSRSTQRTSASGRTAPREVRIPLCAVGGVVAALLAYVALLALSAGSESFAEADWMSSAAGRLSPYGAAVAERTVAFAHAAAQALTWIAAFAPVPLLVLSLLWLARRDQRLYVRLATALLLSGAAGLGVVAVTGGWQAGETSLIRDYLALPGVSAGWYLLMALAVVATTAKTWSRAAASLIALTAATAAVSTTDRTWLAVLSSVVVPLLAWFATGRLRDREEGKPRRAPAAASAGESPSRVVSLRNRARGPEPGVTSQPVPLRQAG
ncbi:hypothetical protein [Streptomyces sp. bgisy027]|uniref:hypothetical protein n=1 Tax=unclassified Streptomyces TaxID=2593676 RepID=UPI003D748A21